MKRFILAVLAVIPGFKIIVETRRTQTPVRFKHLWQYFSKSKVYWPVHHSSLVSCPEKILVGIDVSPGYMPGCYVQGGGGVVIGDYTQISCNVGIISRNHDVYNISEHVESTFPSVVIGKYCWIGMNATILPNVRLPDYCIVGAGSVVTKSVVAEGSVIAGNPAKVIRILDVNRIKKFKNEFEYVGFIPRDSFSKFRTRELQL